MKLSAIVTYCWPGDTDEGRQRESNLKQCLDCIYAQTVKDVELVIVEQIVERSSEVVEKAKKDQHIRISYGEMFNKSWCLNVGVKDAKNDNFIFIDADNVFNKYFFREIVNFHETTDRALFVCWNYLIAMAGKDNPVLRIMGNESCADNTLRILGGVFFSTRAFWNAMGGGNEAYFGYGGEDEDLRIRAEHILKKIHNMDYPLVHLYHDWHKRFPPNPKREWILNHTKLDVGKMIERLNKIERGNWLKPNPLNI